MSTKIIDAVTELRNLYIRAFYRHVVASDLDEPEAKAEQVRQGLQWFEQREAIEEAQVRLVNAGFDVPVSWSVELSTGGEILDEGGGNYTVVSRVPDRDALRQVLREMDLALLKLQQSPSDNPGPWSEPDSPTRWARLFKISAVTFVRHAANGKIRTKQLSDRSYCVHVDDIPVKGK
jgi:hypothetical protein